MQFNTLRRLGSISGRTIAAIALSSATVLALAPSAKAGSTADGAVSATVQAVNDIYFMPGTPPTTGQLEIGAEFGGLYATNNSGTSWTIKAYSLNGSVLKGNSTTSPSSIGYKITPAKQGATGTVVNETSLGTAASPTLLYTGLATEVGTVSILIRLRATAGFNTVKADTYSDTITYVIANGS
jgi:hypothetical protein